jgi:cytochrome c-type biogenesis protein CcmF
MTYDRLVQWDGDDGRNITWAAVTVYRDGQRVGEVHPRRDYYYASQQQMTIPGLRSTIEDDFYVLLVGWEPMAAEGATFRVYHNPLVNFVWLGGIVFILGTLAAGWPDREPVADRVGGRARESAGAWGRSPG